MEPANTEARLVLGAAGCRVTAPRCAVLEAFRRADEHLEADEILQRARERHPAVGRATVYRALDLLTERGVLRPMRGRGGRTHFMRIGRGHDHLVCSRCETVSEVQVPELDQIGRRLARQAGFAVQSHLLEFYGLCPRCQQEGHR